MTEAQQQQQLEDLEKQAAADTTNSAMIVLGAVSSIVVIVCMMYAWKKDKKDKKDKDTSFNPLTDSRKTVSSRLTGMFSSKAGSRKTALVDADEELDAYVLDTKNLPRNHMMKSNWTYYQDDKATDKMEEAGPLAYIMDVETSYKESVKIQKGFMVEFDSDSPVQAVSTLPLPPCLLLCVEITILDFHNGELSFGLSFAPQVKGSWPGGFKGTVGYRSQGVINNGSTKSWIRSKCGGYAAGDIITLLISRDFNERTLHRRARQLNPETYGQGDTPMGATPMSRSTSKEWNKDNLPPRGYGTLLFLKNGIPCQDLPLIMPELRLPQLGKEFMPTKHEFNRNFMVNGEHNVDTPWADLPALFISIACDSRAKVDINVGQETFNFLEDDLYKGAAAGVTLEGMHEEITSIMGNSPDDFAQGLAADLQLSALDEYRNEFSDLIEKAAEPLSPSEQRALEAKRRKMIAFAKIASLSGKHDAVQDIDLENPDPAKFKKLMNKLVKQKPKKVESDENRCRFYKNGEQCDCPSYAKSPEEGLDQEGEDYHEICVCGHHKMYHKPDLNEHLSTSERPMWYVDDEAPEFWEREEAVELLQEMAMESMVSQTRWRTITDPQGDKCWYNLKTGEIRYEPPKAVPWRYAAETFANAFPPVENMDEEESPGLKRRSTLKTGSPMLNTLQKARAKTKKMKTLDKQTSFQLPGAVEDADEDDSDDDGLPPTKTLRVSRERTGTARYLARPGNDITTERYVDRQERRGKAQKVTFATAIDFRNVPR
jgi:hypothetical protein